MSPAYGKEAVPERNVGVISGGEHAGEFDAALKALGWKSAKYADQADAWAKLAAALPSHDLIVATPGAQNLLPKKAGADATGKVSALREFMERGGGIVLTGVSENEQLEWLELLDPTYAVTIDPVKPGKQKPVPQGRHSFLTLPDTLTPEGELAKLMRPQTAREWEVIARWANQPTLLTKRFGKGFLVLTTSRYPGEAFLRNVSRALQLQGLGVHLVRIQPEFRRAEANVNPRALAFGHGHVNLVFQNTETEKKEVEGLVRLSNGKEVREVRAGIVCEPRKETRLNIPILNDLRGEVSIEAAMINPNDQSEIVLYRDSVETPNFLTVVPPAYRGMISTARRDKNVHFKIRFTPLAEQVDGLPLKLSISDPSGKVVSNKEMTVPSKEFAVVMELAADAPEGNYKIAAEVTKLGGIKENAEGTFKIVPVRKGQVFVDQDTVLLKEGKPFFPLGVYHVNEKQIDEAAEVGFNLFQLWTWSATPESMDRLAKKGIYALWEGQAWGKAVHLNPATAHENAAFQKELQLQREAAAKFKDHPALAMWYVADEPSPSYLPILKQINQVWHDVDEDHPTYLVATGNYHLLHEAADILAIDIYPVYRGHRRPLTMVSDGTDAALAGVDHRKPVVAVPQSFGNNPQHNERPEDVRAMSYLFVTHGVKGIVWYCWKETGDQTGVEGAGHHPETQKVLKEVITEIGTIAPALMEPGARQIRSVDGKVHALLCGSEATGRYLVFVNGELSASKSTLHLPDVAGRKLTPVYGSSKNELKNDTLHLEAEPLATGVFKVE